MAERRAEWRRLMTKRQVVRWPCCCIPCHAPVPRPHAAPDATTAHDQLGMDHCKPFIQHLSRVDRIPPSSWSVTSTRRGVYALANPARPVPIHRQTPRLQPTTTIVIHSDQLQQAPSPPSKPSLLSAYPLLPPRCNGDPVPGRHSSTCRPTSLCTPFFSFSLLFLCHYLQCPSRDPRPGSQRPEARWRSWEHRAPVDHLGRRGGRCSVTPKAPERALNVSFACRGNGPSQACLFSLAR